MILCGTETAGGIGLPATRPAPAGADDFSIAFLQFLPCCKKGFVFLQNSFCLAGPLWPEVLH